MNEFQLDFVCVGPQRTGTTWLDRCLRYHPQIYLPRDVKETRFFDLYYDKGLEWYASHFHAQGSETLFGEVGPTYFNDPTVPAKIYEINPNTRIIINLRDPASRIFSLYRHHVFRGHASGSFREVVASTPHLVDSGRYAKYIPKWLNLFDGNVMFILFDDIVSSPEDVLGRIVDFLGVDQIAFPTNIHKKEGVISPPRFRFLAGLAVKLANTLRRFRLHKVVEMGKAMGVNEFLLSGGRENLPELTKDDKMWVLKTHEADIAYVENLLGRDLTKWRQINH